MRTRARLWVTLFLLFGGSALAFLCADWSIADPARFCLYAALAIGASILRARLPDAVEAMWAHPLFVVFGLLELSVPETTVISCACLVVETVWRRGRPVSLLEVYFGLANLMVAIAVIAKLLFWLVPLGLPNVLLAVMAGAVLFAFTTFPWAAVTSLAENRSVLAVWRQAWTSDLAPVMSAAMLGWVFHAFAKTAGGEMAALGVPAVFLLHRSWRRQIERVDHARALAARLAQVRGETIEALALAMEGGDTTAERVRRVRAYCAGIGGRLGLSAAELEALDTAAVLHDIGKLAVPEHIISKPGPLTPDEFERMKVHPRAAADILDAVDFPYPVIPVVRAHHEKWNGTGYPSGLTGEEIPLGARILAAVDAVAALASDRPYRRALPLREAVNRVVAESGASFDPQVVEVLRDCYLELEMAVETDERASEARRPGVTTMPVRTAHRPEELPAPAAPPAGDLLETIARARLEMQDLLDAARGASPAGRDDFFARFAVRLQRLVPHDTLVIWLTDSGASLRPCWALGAELRLFRASTVAMGQGLSGWVAENRRSILNGNPAAEFGHGTDGRKATTMRSALSVPVERGGELLGVLTLYQETRDSFTRDHLSVVQSLTGRLAEGLVRLAGSSTAPSVPTPGPAEARDSILFLRQLAEAMRRSERADAPLAVLVARVESTGAAAEASSEAVRAASALLSDELSDYDGLFRTGPAEFAAILTGAGAHTISERLHQLRRELPGHAGMRLSAGCALFAADGHTPAELLAAAESRVTGPVAAAATVRSSTLPAPWIQ